MKERNTHVKKVIFTLFIAFAIVSFWRGTWGLMDIYLFPENRILSYVISILIGVLILDLTKNMIKKLV